MRPPLTLHGATVSPDAHATIFRAYAPERRSVELALYSAGAKAPRLVRTLSAARLEGADDGFFEVVAHDVGHGALYAWRLDGEGPFPDPASRFQPFGVHGPSQVVDVRRFAFARAFDGRAIDELTAIHEVHVGTATREGTFAALAGSLDAIADLGVSAIELMPIADFPGDRSWGYDGVSLFAPARCYGRPEDLVALVDEAHARGLAVILDVVYNHLGPDGNYLGAYSPYVFTSRHHTPWGDAIDYDGPHARAMRALVLENVRQWIGDYRFDGLRLDATHAIVDDSRPHILTEIAETARRTAGERRVVVIAEDERNEAALVREPSRGGLGLDGVWADDFHHCVRRLLAGDDEGYFVDYRGTIEELARILERGWLFEGQRSEHAGGPRGTSPDDVAPASLVFCVQNHDQVGNRAIGDRLHHVVPLPSFRAAITVLLGAPYTSLLFMGQEFAASTPFAYFTDHKADLGAAVTEGRRKEFARFRAFSDEAHRAAIPDPQADSTFLRSKLDPAEASRPPGASIRALHRELLRIRRDEPAMRARARGDFAVAHGDELVAVLRRARSGGSLLFVAAPRTGGSLALERAIAPSDGRRWAIVLDTEDARFGGEGANATVDGSTVTLARPGGAVLAEVPA